MESNGQIGSGFRAEDQMIADVLAPAGYHWVVYGEWGFGANGSRTIDTTANPLPSITATSSLPNNHGYSDFYGYLNHSAAHDLYDSRMWETDASCDRDS